MSSPRVGNPRVGESASWRIRELSSNPEGYEKWCKVPAAKQNVQEKQQTAIHTYTISVVIFKVNLGLDGTLLSSTVIITQCLVG